MSKELQGEYSGAGYTYRSVRARQGEREIERREDGKGELTASTGHGSFKLHCYTVRCVHV